MILDLRCLDEGPQLARAPVGGCLLEVSVARLDVLPQKLGRPFCAPEVLERGIDVVRQIPLGLSQIADLGGLPAQA